MKFLSNKIRLDKTTFKTIFILFLSLLILILSVSCENKENDKSDIGSDSKSNATIDLPIFDSTSIIHEGLDIEVENDYSNISIETEKDKFSLKDEKIKIVVTNNNVGKGFYIYPQIFLQQKVGNDWKYIDYNDPEFARWGFAGREGNTTEPNQLIMYVFTEFIPNKKAQEYRVVVFLKDREIYTTILLE